MENWIQWVGTADQEFWHIFLLETAIVYPLLSLVLLNILGMAYVWRCGLPKKPVQPWPYRPLRVLRPCRPLFIFKNGMPLSQTHLVHQLQSALWQAGIPTNSYTGYGFRIGVVTDAAQEGLSDSMIHKLGRWKSAVFSTYICTPVEKLFGTVSALVLS